MLSRGEALSWFRLFDDCEGVGADVAVDVRRCDERRYSLYVTYGGRGYLCWTVAEIWAVLIGLCFGIWEGGR